MTNFTINGMDVHGAITVLSSETVAVAEALARVAAADVIALSACPPHSESLRDGYVLALPVGGDAAGHGYPVVGEIAAGACAVKRLTPGTACRIFTGGLIPEGGERVVAQEQCREVHGVVRVAAKAMAVERLFIKTTGSEVACGETVVAQGTRLAIDHLIVLAAVGVEQVQVARRPKIACYCTGNELVAVGGQRQTGQKLSLNSLLLQHLVPCYGGIVVEQCIVADDLQALVGIFNTLHDQRYDLVVSTGGMGPGKYDLVKDAFRRAGGEILLETLAMHPGRSILFGTIGSTVFLALPGPPQAVRTLINELVGPVLLMLQGAKPCRPKAVHARLAEDYRGRESEMPQVKGGVLTVEQGQCLVRLAGRFDPVSCFILLPPGCKELRRGDMVEVHLCPTSVEGGFSHL